MPFILQIVGCWLHSQIPVTYSSKLLEICSFAAYPQFELFRALRGTVYPLLSLR